MAAKKCIIVADDDPHIREVITFALEKANMHVLPAGDGLDVLRLCAYTTVDLVVLDINMPEMDGLECCRELRKTSELPILFLSSRDEELDRIIGLELGGDDYVTKPFSPRELVARVSAILKRTQNKHQQPHTASTPTPTLQVGAIVLDTEQHAVWWHDQPLTLTSTEFDILALLMRTPHKVFSRDAIMDGAYRDDIYVSDRTIDSHIRHIRSKFSAVGCNTLIETVHGVGYKLIATL